MKKLIIFLFINLILYFNSFSQLNDGKYVFKNKEMKLILNASNFGRDLNITLINNKTNKITKTKGNWFQINRNGADSRYDGPSGWYLFQISNCDYIFDEPKNTLILTGQNGTRIFTLTKN